MLYPLRVEAFYSGNQTKPESGPVWVEIDKSATVAELKAKLCTLFKVQEADCAIWDYYKHSKYINLEKYHLNDTVTAAKILEEQPILLQDKVSSAPRIMSSCSMQAAEAARASLCGDADMILCCKGGKELRAHRALLRLASPVLRGLIDDTLGPDDSSIPMPEDDAETWEALLCCLYPTGHLLSISSWEEAELLLLLAHKFDIKHVVAQCKAFVMTASMSLMNVDATDWPGMSFDKLPKDHVLRWLLLADRLEVAELNERCMARLKGALLGRYGGELVVNQHDAFHARMSTASLAQRICTPEFVASFKPETIAKLLALLLLK